MCTGPWLVPRAVRLLASYRFLISTVSAKSVCNLTSNCSPSSSLLFVINRKFPIAAPLPCICLLVGAFVNSGVCIYVCVFTLLDRSLKFEPMRVLFLPVTVLYWTLERAFTRNRAYACAYVYMCAACLPFAKRAPRVALFIHRRHRRRRRSGVALTILFLGSRKRLPRNLRFLRGEAS